MSEAMERRGIRARIQSSDTALGGAIATALGLALVVQAPELARALGGLVLLLLPGLVLAWTLAPRALRHVGPGVVLSGLALATVPIGGLVLNLLPSGLSAGTWIGLGAGLLALAAVVATLSTHRSTRIPQLVRLRRADTGLFALAGIIVLAALLLAGRRGDGDPERFTQVWLVPAAGAATLGIDNLEGATTTYKIDIVIDDETVASWPALVLSRGEQWTVTIDQAVAPESVLEARVYLLDRPQRPYRIVSLAGPLEAAG